MDDLGDLTLIPETASEDRELLCSESKTSVLLIEQPGLECKGRTVVQTDSLFVSNVLIYTELYTEQYCPVLHTEHGYVTVLFKCETKDFYESIMSYYMLSAKGQ